MMETLLVGAIVASVANLVALMVVTGKHSVHIDNIYHRLDRGGL